MTNSEAKKEKEHWVLSSSRGWEHLSFFVQDSVVIKGEVFFVTTIWLIGLFNNRRTDDGLHQEYAIELTQMLLSARGLDKYCQALLNWLKTPIHQLADSRPANSQELCGQDGQVFTMNYDDRQNVIIGIGHYVCMINYKTNFITGECLFITDPTCLQIMADQMAQFISRHDTI
jgi:hypothetical protein